jgi:uncharacterized iron-regulated membrane protein
LIHCEPESRIHHEYQDSFKLNQRVAAPVGVPSARRCTLLICRIAVAIVGFIVAMLSVTGVYLWLKKRRARRWSKARVNAMVVGDAAR